MLVLTFDHEFSFYMGADGRWTMHQFSRVPREGGGSWEHTYHNVSESDPFTYRENSVVLYDAWR